MSASLATPWPRRPNERKPTQAAEGLPRRRFTVAEVEAMVAAGVMEEDERVELIGGELVPMPPKGNRHEVLKTKLIIEWARRLPKGVLFTPETTFRLADDTYLEPDFTFYEASVGLKGLNGQTALLVVEIADSSFAYDTGRKAALYASFGIRELWVIHAVRLDTRVHREPGENGYRSVETLQAAEMLTPLLLPSLAVRLADLPGE
jgi:Uma2 family endonuclease